MKRRFVNVQEVKRLYEEGMLQKDIAKTVGCSPTYITKVLKRLNAAKLPESLAGLTEKEQKFALYHGQGMSQTESALQSFDCIDRVSAKSVGHQLMKREEIRLAVADCRTRAGAILEAGGMGLSKRLGILGRHIENPDPIVSLKAIDMSLEVDGTKQEAKTPAVAQSTHNYTEVWTTDEQGNKVRCKSEKTFRGFSQSLTPEQFRLLFSNRGDYPEQRERIQEQAEQDKPDDKE
jgi:hypothetical protein